MHFLDFFSIIERDLDILNPSSTEKLLDLGEVCRLRPGARVLDVASGKGYMLRLWAKRHEVEGVGLELNPSFVREAREKTRRAGLEDRLRFVEGPAADCEEEPASFDVVTCIGAAFAIGSFGEAVAWMRRFLKPGGVLAIGDTFLPAPLPPDLAGEVEGYLTLAEASAELERQGLEVTYLIAASPDDWDRYVAGGWQGGYRWARANPDHPDRAEVLRGVREGRAQYLSWGRQYVGWAIYVAEEKLG